MAIYVGNISYRISEEDLKEVFSSYGTVKSVKIITDEFSGRSKGFGFVTMNSEEDTDNAITNLNGSELKGHNLRVNRALKKERA